MRDIFPQMERLTTDSFRAVALKIDPNRIQNCFEIFGYDFMIDENFKVYLIEVNTNPCLEICCPLLARIIPELLDCSFRIAVDPLFQPPQLLDEFVTEEELRQSQKGPLKKEASSKKWQRRVELLQLIKNTLVFDEKVDLPALKELFAKSCCEEEKLMQEIQEEEKLQENVQKLY